MKKFWKIVDASIDIVFGLACAYNVFAIPAIRDYIDCTNNYVITTLLAAMCTALYAAFNSIPVGVKKLIDIFNDKKIK